MCYCTASCVQLPPCPHLPFIPGTPQISIHSCHLLFASLLKLSAQVVKGLSFVLSPLWPSSLSISQHCNSNLFTNKTQMNVVFLKQFHMRAKKKNLLLSLFLYFVWVFYSQQDLFRCLKYKKSVYVYWINGLSTREVLKSTEEMQLTPWHISTLPPATPGQGIDLSVKWHHCLTLSQGHVIAWESERYKSHLKV